MQNVQKQAKIALEILHGDNCAPIDDENGEKIVPAIFEIRILTNQKIRYDDDGKPIPNQYNKKVTWSGFFSNPDIAYDALCRFKYEWVGAFTTLQPVSTALYNLSPDKISLNRRAKDDEQGIRGTSDKDVLYRAWINVDVDPIRESETSATDEEKNLAIDTARNIAHYWQMNGMPEPILADSGNGAHLLWSTRLPTDSGLHKRFLNETAAIFNSAKIDIDLTVSNPSRIFKIYGTATRKGEETEERPHRFSSLISVPKTLFEVSGALLTSVLPEIGKETPIKRWHKDGRLTVVGRRETSIEIKNQHVPPSSITNVTPSDGGKDYEIVDIFGDRKTENFVADNDCRTTQEIFDEIGEFTKIPGSKFYSEKVSAIAKIHSWGYSTFPAKIKPGITIHEFKECPCHRKLTDGTSALYEMDSGAIAFGCKHASCEFSEQDKQNKWALLREKHEPRADLTVLKDKKKNTALRSLPFVSESLEIIANSLDRGKKTVIPDDTDDVAKEDFNYQRRSVSEILSNNDGLQNNDSVDIDIDLSMEDIDTPEPKELKLDGVTGGTAIVYSQAADLTKFNHCLIKLEKIGKIWALLASVTLSDLPRTTIGTTAIHKKYGTILFDIDSIVSKNNNGDHKSSDVKTDRISGDTEKKESNHGKDKKNTKEATIDIPIDLQGILDSVPAEDIEKSDGGNDKINVDKPGKFTKIIRGKDKRRLVDVFQDWMDMRDAIFDEFTESPGIYCSQNRLSYVDTEKNSMIAMDGPALDDQSWKLCAFVQFKQTESGSLIAIPKSVPKRIIESFEYLRPEDRARLRKVERVISTPFFDKDGEFVSTPGYHEKSSTYMIGEIDVDGKTLQRKDNLGNITQETLTLTSAVKYIYDFLSDFEFESHAERSNYLGTLLTPMVRSMIDGPVPMTVLEANKRGSGKSYLAKIIQTIYGEIPDAGGLPIDEESIEKLMTSILIEAKPIHLFDNVTHKVSSATLDRVLTTGWFSGRLLGKTQNLHCKVLQLFLLTANNARMSPDMSRRFVRVRLKSTYANPERRNDFKIDDIIGWVKNTENRRNILSCLAFLVKSWVSSDKPKFKNLPTMGSYENWRSVIGNIMYFIGEKPWLSNLTEATEAVIFTDDWEIFFDSWIENIGPKASLSQLFELACNKGLLGGVMGRGDADQKKYALRVGLFSRRDDIISNFCLRIEKDSHAKSFSYNLDRVASVMTNEEKELAEKFDIANTSNAVSVLDEIGKDTKYGDQSNFSPTYKPEMTYREREDQKDGMKPFFDEEDDDDVKEEWWQK